MVLTYFCGIVAGLLLGVAILGWIVHKFVIGSYILKPIRKEKALAYSEKSDEEIAVYVIIHVKSVTV